MLDRMHIDKNIAGKVERHNNEIHQNLNRWNAKPLLRKIYKDFHHTVAGSLSGLHDRYVVELGSGIGNIKETIPDCLRTDIFSNPWIDQVENAYALSFADAEISDLILIDVFHHLRYPGVALSEFHRVLRPGGRVILLEPRSACLDWLCSAFFIRNR